MWTPFKRAKFVPMDERKIEALARQGDVTVEVVKALLKKEEECSQIFLNNRYQVTMSEAEVYSLWPQMWHLSIKRIDKEPIHDWRDLQRIKNEVVGEEYEAIELYPAESRRVDTSNQYHLWVFKDKFTIPIGFLERRVQGPEKTVGTGAKQRSFEED